MKKIILSAVLVLMASSAFAVGITGTKHDFSSLAGNTNTYKGTSDQICKYCHVPHNAKTTNILWSRTGGTAVTSFYDSETMNATAAAPGKPQSTLCLSCHSATPDNNNYLDFGNGGVIAAGTKQIAGADGGADDMRNDHPIGFAYNAALVTADGGLVAVTAGASSDYVGATGSKLPLFGATTTGTLECASCHAVHGVGTIPMFLRTTNAGSVLCLKCHIK